MLFPFISDTRRRRSRSTCGEFINYVEAHDVKPVHGRTYLANPGLTVLDIWEAMSRKPRLPTSDG